ncbi:MAG: hypothetical protein AAGI72_06575, partial [Pseudomonadota bacterium]
RRSWIRGSLNGEINRRAVTPKQATVRSRSSHDDAPGLIPVWRVLFGGCGVNKILVKSEQSMFVELSPEIMAKAFWGMDSEQQAAFFEALHDEISENSMAYGLGEKQWCYMAGDMSPKAREMYMALSGFAYRWWPQKNLDHNLDFEVAP